MPRSQNTPTPEIDRFEIGWPTLCDNYVRSVSDYQKGKGNTDSHAQSYVINSTASKDSWWGNSHTEMVDYIHNGYDFPTSVDPSAIPMVEYEREHTILNDDPLGEFQYDLYIAGDTDYYRSRPVHKTRAGIRVCLGFGWRSGTASTVIGDYGAWIGALIKALQAKGHDLEVCVYTRGTNRYYAGATNTSEHYVWLTKFGERVMPNTYSALFTPGGYRHFFFYYYGLEEQLGTHGSKGPLEASTGGSILSGWSVKWNAHTRELIVSVDSGARSFPMQSMTQQLEGLDI